MLSHGSEKTCIPVLYWDMLESIGGTFTKQKLQQIYQQFFFKSKDSKNWLSKNRESAVLSQWGITDPDDVIRQRLLCSELS